MAERESYYFITVFRKLEIDDKGWPDVGGTRCWGFYKDKDTAFQAVHENWTDIEETVYHYAVIEEYYEGICNYTGHRQFFEFNVEKGGYMEIDEPKGYEHFQNFSISALGRKCMNTRIRQQIKAVLRRKNPKIFATIRENGITRVQFVAQNERDHYKVMYGDKIRFWNKEVQDG